jgi:hypothetical protein
MLYAAPEQHDTEKVRNIVSLYSTAPEAQP